MAQAKKSGTARSSKTHAETLMGDIRTAARSTMGDGDYAMGYPPRPGTLHNTNFSGKAKKTGRS